MPTNSTADGETFPLPEFTPAIVLFRACGGELVEESIVNLVDGSGTPITGLTNDTSDDKPYDSPCSTTALPFNPNAKGH